jgi:hypothetical protein
MFLSRLEDFFAIKAGQKVLRSADEQIKVMICQLRRKTDNA